MIIPGYNKRCSARETLEKMTGSEKALRPDHVLDHIVDGIYVSGWRAIQHTDALRAAGIISVLKLADHIPGSFPADFIVLDNPLDDSAFVPLSVLKRGTGFIQQQVQAGRPVLVMCMEGVSRSATFIMAYLIECGHDLPDAYRLVRRAHPETEPPPPMWQSLITHYRLAYTIEDTWRWMQAPI